jgi:hypothetical protein
VQTIERVNPAPSFRQSRSRWLHSIGKVVHMFGIRNQSKRRYSKLHRKQDPELLEHYFVLVTLLRAMSRLGGFEGQF